MVSDTISEVAINKRGPLWPVLVAPIVAGVYYLSIKLAFAESIVLVLGRTDFFDLSIPRWGSHWIYRVTAEVVAVGLGTYIAAGLAFGRERAAAIVGGCIISTGFIGKFAVTYLVWNNQDPDASLIFEPWYQYAIDGVLIFAAPFVGSFVAEAAEDMHRDTPVGFGGINRFHLLWLWLVVYWYALGLITPMARLYVLHDNNIFAIAIAILINGIPAAAIAIPGYYGITFLAGHRGDTLHPAGRNLVGVLVLVFGLLVGIVIQYGWYSIMQKISQLIFG